MNDQVLRSISFMQDRILAFESGEISLGLLVDQLGALSRGLEWMDDPWQNAFFGELEKLRPMLKHVSGKRLGSLPESESRRVGEAIDNLRQLFSVAADCETDTKQGNQTTWSASPVSNWVIATTVLTGVLVYFALISESVIKHTGHDNPRALGLAILFVLAVAVANVIVGILAAVNHRNGRAAFGTAFIIECLALAYMSQRFIVSIPWGK